MRDYHLELEIGGYVEFAYSHPQHRLQDEMDRTGQQLANQMDQL